MNIHSKLCRVPLDGEMTYLETCDTAGQEDYQAMRRLAYTDCHVFLVVCSFDSLGSLQNAK